MKSKLFRRSTENGERQMENGQRKTVLSPEGHLSSRVARVMPTGATRSGGISSFGRFLATLGMTALLYWPATAQNGVTLLGLMVDAGTVTFNISWDKASIPKPDGKEIAWSDTVWVFVDYNDAGTITRLPLLPGATLTHTSAQGVGRVKEESGNNKGVWIIGNARDAGHFFATVQLLTEAIDISGACVYASNYPPVGRYTAANRIAFTGTPPYELVLEYNDNEITGQSNGTFTVPEGYTLLSFTDKTGAPGTFICNPPPAPEVAEATFCFGLPGHLTATALGDVTVGWYDAPDAGNLLYTGSVLPLTPLYNNTAQYYAEAAITPHCVSARTAAQYTVNNCAMTGECPDFTAGSVGSTTTPAACTSFYAGRIGAVDYPVACVAFDAGHIGRGQ